MEEIPDDLDPAPARRLDEGSETGEIVAAAAVDERPADGLAGGVDAERREVAIIALDGSVVPGRRHLIEPPAVAVIARRALEAREEEAAKHRAIPCAPSLSNRHGAKRGSPLREAADRAGAAGDEIAIGVDEGRSNPRQGGGGSRVDVPQAHLQEVGRWRPSALAIGPGDEGEERPPSVAEDRNALLAQRAGGPDRGVEPGAAAARASRRDAVSEMKSGAP